MDIVRVGIIGVGNMGSSHAKKIVAGECPAGSTVMVTAVDGVLSVAVSPGEGNS
jgi:3-hydroxyisobutyrate dehydrogenase-like beta-hydroxyacid dehydrogenase